MTQLTVPARCARIAAMAMALCVALPGGTSAGVAPSISLSSDRLRVVVSASTGQVVALSDRAGTRYLAGGEDLYHLGERASSEAKDVVVSQRKTRDGVTLACENRELGLSPEKAYRLVGSVLVKEVRYARAGAAPAKELLKVSSRSRLDPSFYAKGYYYTPVDDGYKVHMVPFLPAKDVTMPSAWTVSTGGLVFYAPARNRVFTHYRYRVNGGYVLGETNGIRSEYEPGGAVTSLGQGFVDSRTPLSVESRYALIEGDPRAFHRHLYGQAPYTAHRKGPMPGWFRNARMYFGDGLLGTGRGLIEQTDAVAEDIRSMLKLLPEETYLMVFFNHWSTSGDFPYTGTFRYFRYTPAEWSRPVPVETLREKIRFIKSLSPRVKVGGYFYFAPSAGTPPYEQHKDWFVYEKSGAMVAGSDGIGAGGFPDFTTPYREYLMDQLKHAVTDTGFDWLHLDTAVWESVNYRTRNVAQSWETARFYEELSRFATDHGAALVQNVAWATALWAQGSYLECQQPDRWEKRDWRILGASGYTNALYRTLRPGTWVNLVYGTPGAYGTRNSFTGMRGWVRNASAWWDHIALSLAREEVADELLATTVSDLEVHPCWWKLETDRLEAQALRAGSATIIPVVLHAERPATETLSLRTADLHLKPSAYTFAIDLRLPPPAPLDAFKPAPAQADRVTLTGFRAHRALAATYTRRMALEPRANAYHILSQTPAWVCSANGRRASLLLPENRGVTIQGILPPGAQRYGLVVENANRSAELLAYVPREWTGARVQADGKAVPARLFQVLGERCLRFAVKPGRSRVVVAAAGSTGVPLPYSNPPAPVWTAAAERILYSGVSHRAYHEAGKSCLELKGAGMAHLPIVGGRDAGGFSLQAKGTRSGGKLQVLQDAGDRWVYTVADDFTGWKEFAVRRDAMTTASKTKRWEKTSAITLLCQPAGSAPIHVADIHLLPARPGDIVVADKAPRRFVALRAPAPPAPNGSLEQPCWKNAAMLTGFFGYGKATTESQTQVRACYDDDSLYVRFDNLESIENLGTRQPRDAAIWNTNHVELFIDPFRDGTQYFHLLVDPAGTIEDERASKTGRSHDWNGDFQVRTSLNWKASWVAEFTVPFRALERKPRPGDVWGISFARKDISGEWSNWATAGEWLDPSYFGQVEFGGDTAPTSTAPADKDLLFHASFDGTLTPEVGRDAAPVEASKDLRFTEGRRGQALVAGHAFGVGYPAAGNLKLEEGTISVWVRPLNWNLNQQLFHHFVAVQGPDKAPTEDARPFHVLLYKFREWDQVLAYGMQQWLTRQGLVAVSMKPTWKPDTWHHVAFAWDARGQKLVVDGEAVRREWTGKAPDVLNATRIRVGGPYYLANEALTAIDDLRIYNRCLTDAEIGALP